MKRTLLFRSFIVAVWISFIMFLAINPIFTFKSTNQLVQVMIEPLTVSLVPATPSPPLKEGNQQSENQQRADEPSSKPGITEPGITELANHWIRRLAHVFIYGVLGFLLFWAIEAIPLTSLSWVSALGIGLGASFADEYIQGHMSGRSARGEDLLLDGIAVASALLLSGFMSWGRPPRQAILQAVTMGEIGGAQRILYSLVKATASLRPTFLVCGPGDDLPGWVQEDPKRAHVQVVRLPSVRRNACSPWHDMLSLFHLVRMMQRIRPLIVHLHSSKMGILGRIAAWICGVPIVFYTAHGWPLRSDHGRLAQWLFRWAETFAAFLTDRIICVSAHERELALRYRLAPPGKLVTITNGVSPPPIGTGHLRTLLSLSETVPLVVAVGRMAMPKDPLAFIALAQKTRESLPNAQFVWIGDGPLLAECERAVSCRHLEGRVNLLGARSDARLLMNDANVVVLLSRAEGLPLVLIEAMMAGKPVLSSAVGGVGELITHEQTGLLCSAGDDSAAAAALVRLLSDHTLAASLALAGKAKAWEQFSEQQMIRAYLHLYRDEMKSHGVKLGEGFETHLSESR